ACTRGSWNCLGSSVGGSEPLSGSWVWYAGLSPSCTTGASSVACVFAGTFACAACCAEAATPRARMLAKARAGTRIRRLYSSLADGAQAPTRVRAGPGRPGGHGPASPARRAPGRDGDCRGFLLCAPAFGAGGAPESRDRLSPGSTRDAGAVAAAAVSAPGKADGRVLPFPNPHTPGSLRVDGHRRAAALPRGAGAGTGRAGAHRAPGRVGAVELRPQPGGIPDEVRCAAAGQRAAE